MYIFEFQVYVLTNKFICWDYVLLFIYKTERFCVINNKCIIYVLPSEGSKT